MATQDCTGPLRPAARHECWITDRAGIVRRIEIEAVDVDAAVAEAFARHPAAAACSARVLRITAPQDAIGHLARRAEDVL